jgi:hypothetical protein
MKRISLTIIICLASLVSVLAQETTQSESQKISVQIDTLYKQGKIDEAIGKAEKLVKIEAKTSLTSASYADAITTLANLLTENLRIGRAKGLPNQSIDRELEAKRRIAWTGENNEIADKAESLFRQALIIYNRPIDDETTQTATIKGQLAWVRFHYQGKRVYTIDDVRPRIDEIELFYSQAIASHEKLLGKNSDLTLRTYIEFADFYLIYVNFEKALPYFELYQTEIEKKFGTDSKKLLKCLIPIARILIMSERQSEAVEIKKRIDKLSGRNEVLTSFDLTVRSKDLLAQHYVGKELKKGRAVKVEILVDESGKIVEAIAKTDKERIESDMLKMTVRPFIYNNIARKMRGYFLYIMD